MWRRHILIVLSYAMAVQFIPLYLQVLFTQFQYSDLGTIPSDCLRKALAETFAVTGRFQLRLMDDAAECFVRYLIIIIINDIYIAPHVLKILQGRWLNV